MMNKFCIGFFCFCFSIAQGQDQKGEYWYELDQPKGEWNELFIQNEIAHILQGDFSSIRIYSLNNTGDTLEVPYVLRNNLPIEETHQMNFEVFNKNTRGDFNYYTFKPNGKELLNRINLKIEENEFDERLTLEGSNDQKEWFTIVEDYRILSLNKDNIHFSYTDIEFSAVDYTFLRLKMPKTLTFQSAYLLGSFVEGGIENDNQLQWKVKQVPDKKETEIYISLNEYSTVRSFEIDIADEVDYFRKCELYYLKDSTYYLDKWHKNYKRIYRGDLTSVRKHREIFETVFTSELKFVIHNGDNQSLTIENINAKGNEYSLVGRFKQGYDKHYLFYQDNKKRAPQYDISRFQDNIPDILGKMKTVDFKFAPYPSLEKEPFFKSNWWIWGIMILVILVIGRFTIQMLKDS